MRFAPDSGASSSSGHAAAERAGAEAAKATLARLEELEACLDEVSAQKTRVVGLYGRLQALLTGDRKAQPPAPGVKQLCAGTHDKLTKKDFTQYSEGYTNVISDIKSVAE